MRITILGSSGQIGAYLTEYLRNKGHHVTELIFLVYGFVDGKPLDAFQGAQPESKVEAMVDKMIEATPGNEIPKLIEEADQLFSDQKFEESLKHLLLC